MTVNVNDKLIDYNFLLITWEQTGVLELLKIVRIEYKTRITFLCFSTYLDYKIACDESRAKIIQFTKIQRNSSFVESIFE